MTVLVSEKAAEWLHLTPILSEHHAQMNLDELWWIVYVSRMITSIVVIVIMFNAFKTVVRI